MMKKLLILFAAVLLFLASCGTEVPASTSASESADVTEEVPLSSEAEDTTKDVTTSSTPQTEPAAVEYPPKTYTACILPGVKKVQGKLAERLDVPEHVEGTYTSPSGITRVTVDADIVFPDIEKVNIYQAAPRVFTQEEIGYFSDYFEDDIDYFNDGQTWVYADQDHLHQPWDKEIPSMKIKEDVLLYNVQLKNLPVDLDIPNQNPFNWDEEKYRKDLAEALKEYLPEDQIESFYIKHFNLSYALEKDSVAAIDPKLEFLGKRDDVSLMDPLQDNQAVGSGLTLTQAIEMAEQAVKPILPDFELSAFGQTSITDASKARNLPQVYSFLYTRTLDNIPVRAPRHYGLTAEFGFISDQERLTVVVGDGGIEYLRYNSPFTVGDMTEEDVSLLPFSEIMSIYEKMLLLSVQHHEINNEELKENLMDIFEIRFGYMAVYMNDGTYQYTPVWDFYGTQHQSGTGAYAYAQKDSIPVEYEFSQLTLNAITGDVIDRSLGY